MPITLAALRRYAVARSLFEPTTLAQAMDRLGFVQADPIRAPARAQDLTLRHRVGGYRAGDLDRAYAELGVEEDYFVVYGFLPRPIQALMHPRERLGMPIGTGRPWSVARRRRAQALLDFVRERGVVHPREVDERFSHGRVINYWGGSSNATTQLLDAMHYRGLLRVARRERGVRLYAVRERVAEPEGGAERLRRIDTLVDVAVGIYAPLPAKSLHELLRRLRYAVPQWRGELRQAVERGKRRLACARIEGDDWYWPAGEDPVRAEPPSAVRFLAPFDPVVWDRARLERLWGWRYRFEAYTPAAKRKLGYYALPMVWRDRVVGWANVSVNDRRVRAETGYVASRPTERAFKGELGAEIDRLRAFLGLES
ncbi:MAG TPA: crosslink repair DNA glycosylase YcaQ family protein [Casimicrobiaceae bacterium]|nr:crosslink repair DNA glycosylase YcaQ family protein [Casimicrobiaceae bacterium]